MKEVLVPDVGHGLAVQLKTLSNKRVQIDCGSDDNSRNAYRRTIGGFRPVSTFFLSHFHTDHYNGLIAAPESQHTIEKVVYPQMPDHKKASKFLRALFSTDYLRFTVQTGSLPGNIHQEVHRINKDSVETTFRPVSQGDTVSVGSTKFEVLWPPDDPTGNTIKPLVDGVELFDEALEEDDMLRKIYDKVVTEEVVEPFLPGQRTDVEVDERTQGHYDINSLIKEYELSETAEEAHKKLRSVANRMSLAMHIDNRLLFMADLKKADIDDVVDVLLEKDRTHFHLLITPHHGTHWDDSMNEIDSIWAVSSAGEQTIKNLESFVPISDRNWVTHFNGDFAISTDERRYLDSQKPYMWF